MTIQILAHFYVYDLVPLLKIIGIVLIVIFVLQLFNLMSGKEKKFPVIDKLFISIIKITTFIVVGGSKLILAVSKTLLGYIRLIFATVVSFFTDPH